jgi:hypothetical protein
MSLLNPLPILADVAPNPGYTRNFNYCFKITNLNKYPQHLLFVEIRSAISDTITEPYFLVKAGKCIPIKGYRPVATIAAIPKNKVQQKDLQNKRSGTILKNTKLQKSFIKGNSDILLPPNAVPIINEGKTIEGRFKIESIDRNGLKLAPLSDSISTLNILLFPLIGIAIIGGMMWNYKQNLASVK